MSSTLQHRRRKATQEELRQGQLEIEAAHKRMSQEASKRGEIPLEDVKGDSEVQKEVGGKGDKKKVTTQPQHGTPSSTALPSTGDSKTKSDPVRTPEPTRPMGPPKSLGPVAGPQSEEKVKEVEEKPKALANGGWETTEDGEVGVIVEGPGDSLVVHSISTPPDLSAREPPLFSREQLQGLHQMYAQAPLLYPQFETPQPTPAPVLRRPPFLEFEEVRERGPAKSGEDEFQLRETQKALEETAFYEQWEKQEMSRHLQFLLMENRKLKDQVQGSMLGKEKEDQLHSAQLRQLWEENQRLKTHLSRVGSSADPGGEDPVRASQMGRSWEEKDRTRRLWEENQRLKDDLRRSLTAPASSKEEEFATPSGSTGAEGVPARPDGGPTKEDEEQEASAPAERSGKGRGTGKEKDDAGPGDVNQQTLTVILKLVEGMQKIQEKMVSGHAGESGPDPETVRASVDLPRLPEWTCESGPIDFADWLLVLAPLMSDLSSSSEEWWSMTVEEAKEWYRQHMLKSPLERLSHRAVPSPKLQQKKWSRLERRASALLMGAVPEALREEVVTSKSITAFGILTKGMVAYQPGGLAERQAILAALETPAEATTIQSAVLTLRRWIRWKRRAEEVGVSIPDPTILAKGVSRITKKMANTYPELNFRLQLIRSSLMVDSIPTHDSINKYSEHLLAELEQLGHQSRKKDPVPEPPKIKKFEEAPKFKKEGEDKKESEKGEEKKGRCRFFLTDQGCRRGKGCTFSHDMRDDRRRCWNCGGIGHMSPNCTRPKDTKEGSSNKPKIAKVTKEKGEKEKNDDDEGGSEKVPSVKELLKEANDMLKSMSSSPTSSTSPSVKGENERMEVVERLQQQLNSLKQKTFRIKRMKAGEKEGLVDSGATHTH